MPPLAVGVRRTMDGGPPPRVSFCSSTGLERYVYGHQRKSQVLVRWIELLRLEDRTTSKGHGCGWLGAGRLHARSRGVVPRGPREEFAEGTRCIVYDRHRRNTHH